ncbi:MAG: glycosyltransferase family 2 protein [Hyphomicrobiales bacterium]|nr:glycosyltransferase family 2 protein [Hyphomicrobiales bacterium]
MPKVTIGMPLYNGAHLLREGLESLARQTYDDFEVLICENGSTDDSRAIAEEFVARDRRFRMAALDETISAWDNFARCLTLSQSPYFAWRAYDDYAADNFIEALARGLDAHPQAQLAACEARTLNVSSGRERRFPTPALAADPARARRQLLAGVRAQWFYGLYRREAVMPVFRQCQIAYPHEWAGDHLMLYPFLIKPCVFLTNETWFMQRTGFARGRTPAAPAVERAIFRDYVRFCARRVDEAALPAREHLYLKARLSLDAHRHTFRMTRLLRRAIIG